MREKLERQADTIETVLSSHCVPVRVTGGTVTPRWVRFQVLPNEPALGAEVKRLSDVLSAALGVSDCRVSQRGAAVDVEVPRDDPAPVQLLSLCEQLADGDGDIPPATAVLGLAEDGVPLLIRIPSPDVSHVLVAGSEGAGKTTLLQAIALSLAMYNPAPAEDGEGLALVLADPAGSGAFDDFAGLPHLASPIVPGIDGAVGALKGLVAMMNDNSPARPRIVAVVDDLHLVPAAVAKNVAAILAHGRAFDVHLVAATDDGFALAMPWLARLVGRVSGVEDAQAATGWTLTGAERLAGKGDFLAIAEGRAIRFQGAHVSPEEIREAVARLAQSSDVMPAAASYPVERAVEVFNRK